MNEIEQNDCIFATLFAVYVGLIFFVIAFIFSLIALYHLVPHTPPLTLPLIAGDTPAPKPCENFVVLCSSLFIPFIAIIYSAFIAKSAVSLRPNWIKPFTFIFSIIIFIASLYAFHSTDFEIDWFNHHGYAFVIGSFFLYALIWRFDLSKPYYFNRPPLYRRLWVGSIIVLVLLFIFITLGFRLIDINNLTVVYSGSIDAVMYSLSQALSGKMPLVNFPSQYGYFSVFLVPILNLFGLAGHSLLAVTFIFAVLLAFSFYALFFVLAKELRYTSIFFFSALCIVFLSTKSYNWAVGGYNDPYYQYDPIRFFWPALSVLLFYFYAKKPSFSLSLLFSLLAGIAIIWNEDTGIPIAGSFCAFLLYRILLASVDKKRSFSNVKTEVIHVFFEISLLFSVIVLGLMFFLFYIFIKSGGPIQYSWLFKYQKVFYVMGYNMLPMPLTLHPWMLVIGVYLFGLVFSQFYLYRGKGPQSFASLILYLSFLGVGLFIYYTGRSHIDNLLLVMWPAIMIAALLLDRFHAFWRENKCTGKLLWLMTLPFWLAILTASINQLSLVPRFIKASDLFLSHLSHPEDPIVADELRFINSHKREHKECIILSARQGIYYLETGLANPISGPGLMEILLESDRVHVMQSIFNGTSPCVFYGIGKYSLPPVHIPLSQVLTRYQVQAENQEKSMLFLVPQSSEK